MSFYNVMTEHLKELNLRPKSLYISANPVKLEAVQNPLPPSKLFEFELEGERIRWTYVPVLEPRWGGSTVGAMVGLGGTLSYKQMESVRHDLVCQVLFGKMTTDKKLSEIGRLNQPSDNMTPDMIIETDDLYLVAEVGTTQSPNDGALSSLYYEKLNKYSGYLKELSLVVTKPIYYVVFAVSQSKVYSSVDLGEETVNDLVYRARMGVRFERAYQSSGLRKVVENQESSQLVNLRSNISAFSDSIIHHGKPGFDAVSIDGWARYKADLQYLEEMETFVINQTTQDIEDLQAVPPLEQVQKGFQAVEADIAIKGGLRLDEKSPVQMILALPDRLKGSCPTFEIVPNEADSLNEIAELWNLCTIDASCHLERFHESPLEEEVERALFGNSESLDRTRLDKRDFHRVDTSGLSHRSKALLATDGFRAKSFKKSDEMSGVLQDKRTHTQTSFSTNAPTGDIEEVLVYEPSYLDIGDYWPEWSSVEELIGKANDLQGNSASGFDTVKSILNTDVCSALLVISSIAAELSVSHKQNCRGNQMIYKRINGLCLEMLIYPTNSTSHIFFTLRYKGRPLMGVDDKTFRQATKIGEWFYTPMLSTDSSRLENMIKAPFTWINSIIHWRIWYSKLSKEDVSDQFNDKEKDALKLTWISLLISLEDKSTTEELVTSLRYISMNFFKGDDSVSPMNLTGAIKKIPTVLRSRLATYLFKTIKQYCLLQAAVLPTFDFRNLHTLQEDRNGDKWTDLICPYLNKEVDNCQCIVQLFYIGYAKNKNTTPSENSDYALIEKIITHIVNKDPKKEEEGLYLGMSEPVSNERPGPHEFSKNAFAAACDIAVVHLKSTEGENYRKVLDDQILNELVHKSSYEALATLKASFNFDMDTMRTLDAMRENEEKITHVADSQNDNQLKFIMSIAQSGAYTSLPIKEREKVNNMIVQLKKKSAIMKKLHNRSARSKSCKCHEAVIKSMKELSSDSCLPLDSISQVYNSTLNTWGGICCYLFKKAQHGGIREIYVLTFYSRLLQLFVETVGRVLCSHFQMEVMTHPNEKTAAIHRHFSDLKKTQIQLKETTSILTRSSSEDKSKWSQNNNVSCYAFILSKILSPTMARACARILMLWKTKKILLPDGVIKLLDQDLEKDDPAYEQLRAEYWGRAHPMLLKSKGSKYLISDTGMWQGILHYLSSFQHVLQVLHFQNMVRRVFLPRLRDNGAVDMKLTNLVSSDDSLTLMSVVVNIGDDDRCNLSLQNLDYINKIMSLALHCEDLHSSFFMMKESPKSCMASTTVFEFNSIFHIAQGAVSPVIKKVLCCTNVVQSELFVVKFRSTYNAIKDILEEGGSHYQVHMHQIVCGLLHYFIMGSTTTSLFRVWASLMVEKSPNPHLGFFILDTDLIAGLMGYDYSQYVSLIDTNVPCMISTNVLIQGKDKGVFLNAVLFMHGNRKRWEKLKERVLEPGWEEQVDSNPEILYKAYSDTKEEARLRLSMKACSKGVYEALVVGGKLSSILAASVYMLRDPVMTVRSTDYDEESSSLEKMQQPKVSLLAITKNQIELSGQSFPHYDMSDDHKSLVYPNHGLYDLVRNLAGTVRTETIGVEAVPFRKVKNQIVLRTPRANSKIPLMSCCRKKWFNMIVRSPRTLVEDSWSYYKTMFSWLNDDIEVTLTNSPFTTHSEMYRFIQGLQETSSSVRILAKRFTSNQTYGKIKESMLYNQYPGFKLSLSKEGKAKVLEDTAWNSGSCREFQSLLNLALMHPAAINTKLREMESIIAQQDFEFNDQMLVGLNPAESRQLILLALLSGMDKNKIISLLTKVSGHIVAYFSIPQSYDGRAYRGYGCLTMAFKDFVTESHFYDDILILQTTTDMNLLKLNHTVIMDELAKAKIIVPDSTQMMSLRQTVKKELLPQHVRNHLYWESRPRPEQCFTNAGFWRCIGSAKPVLAEIMVVDRSRLMSDTTHLELQVVDLGDNQISLQAYALGGQSTHLCRFSPLARTRPTEDLADLWDYPIDVTDDLQCWMLNTPRDANSLINDLKALHLKKDFNSLTKDDVRKVDFFRRTLLNRAIFSHKLTKTLRLTEFDSNLDSIMEAGAVMNEDEYNEMLRTADDAAYFAINAIRTDVSGSVGGLGKRVSKPPMSSAVESTLESTAQMDVGHWVQGQEKGGNLERSPSRSSLLTVKELDVLQSRLNAGVRVDLSDISVDKELQSYFLHHYWDDFIKLIEEFNVWRAFKDKITLPEQMRQTCEVISWIIDRPCYAEFASAPF